MTESGTSEVATAYDSALPKGHPDRVRQSARYVIDNAGHVRINEAAITKFLSEIEPSDWTKFTSVVPLPLKFASVESEVNFLSLLNILNIGSGYRKMLHQARDRGAYETILYGVISIHLAGVPIDTKLLSGFKVEHVRDYFDIPFLSEKPLQTGLYVVEKNGLYPLAEAIVNICNEAGQKLSQLGKRDFASLIIPFLRSLPSTSAVALVQLLVQTFEAFDDKAVYKGKEVVLYKKAQLLVGELYRNMKEKDKLFDFPDIDLLTVYTDNVLPAVLRKLDILVLDDELKNVVDTEGEIKAGSEYEVELRAGAVAASEDVVAAAQKTSDPFSVLLLDYYLWSKGKDGDFRKVERHYTRDTIFY